MQHFNWHHPIAWVNHPGFVSLGEYRIQRGAERDSPVDIYDLYAIRASSGRSIDFGARYGNEPHEYLSGEAFLPRNDMTWDLVVSGVTAIAAARYFANHHEC